MTTRNQALFFASCILPNRRFCQFSLALPLVSSICIHFLQLFFINETDQVLFSSTTTTFLPLYFLVANSRWYYSTTKDQQLFFEKNANAIQTTHDNAINALTNKEKIISSMWLYSSKSLSAAQESRVRVVSWPP